MSKVFKPKSVEQTNTMDLVRERRKGLPRIVYVIAGIVVLIGLAVWALNSLTHQSASPIVDKSTLVTDVARRGTLVRSVSAQGAFAPERTRIASATQSGVVNTIFVKPGTPVVLGTIIAQMTNPTLVATVTNDASKVQVAQANLADTRQQVQADVITKQSALQDALASLQSDELNARLMTQMHRTQLVTEVQYKQAVIKAKQSEDDVASRRAEVGVAKADAQAKIASQEALVAQAQATLTADQAQVDALTVRSATSGIVQSVDADPGASVAQGAAIAHIADEHDLKAVLQVAETDVHDVQFGMQAQIDTGNGIIDGRVTHIAPQAQNGSVAVDVTFNRALPSGARPDANVEGTIILSTIPDAISIARPASASDNSSIDLFKVVAGGSRAVRVRVRLGQGSTERVQVLSGIAPGDTVIVSDMSNDLDQSELRLR